MSLARCSTWRYGMLSVQRIRSELNVILTHITLLSSFLLTAIAALRFARLHRKGGKQGYTIEARNLVSLSLMTLRQWLLIVHVPLEQVLSLWYAATSSKLHAAIRLTTILTAC